MRDAVTAPLRPLWARRLSGPLTSDDIDAIEGLQDMVLRGARLEHEATLGHRFLQTTEQGVTLIRVRRSFDSGDVTMDLVTSDPVQTVEDWEAEIQALNATVRTVESMRRERVATAAPRAFIAFASTASPATEEQARRIVEAVREAGIEADTSGPFTDLSGGPLHEPTPAGASPWTWADNRARMANADLIVILVGTGAVGGNLAHYTGLHAAPTVIVSQNYDALLLNALGGHVSERHDLRRWVHDALPDIRARARARRTMFAWLSHQLPRARARLVGLDNEIFERNALSRQAALWFLHGPAEFASATMAEAWALQEVLGARYVPRLQFHASYQDVLPAGRVDHDWVSVVAGSLLTAQEVDRLAQAAMITGAGPATLVRALEAYVELADTTGGSRSMRFRASVDWERLLAPDRLADS